MTGSRLLPRWFAATWTVLAILFIVAPLVTVTLVSFTTTLHVSLPLDGFTLHWFELLLGRDDFISAGLNSARLAGIASVVALLLGTLGALAVVRYRFRARSVVNLLGTSPLFVPMIMSGLAILIFFSSQGWGSHFSRLFVGHVAITLPFVLRTVTSSLTGFNLDQELAAQNLGATRLKAFLQVTLPQIRTGILAGAVLALVVSFDNVALSIFLAGSRYSVLPVELFFYASYNNDPLAAAVSVAMIVFAVTAIVLVERLFGIRRLLGGVED